MVDRPNLPYRPGFPRVVSIKKFTTPHDRSDNFFYCPCGVKYNRPGRLDTFPKDRADRGKYIETRLKCFLYLSRRILFDRVLVNSKR